MLSSWLTVKQLLMLGDSRVLSEQPKGPACRAHPSLGALGEHGWSEQSKSGFAVGEAGGEGYQQSEGVGRGKSCLVSHYRPESPAEVMFPCDHASF